MHYIEGKYPRAALAILRELAGERVAEQPGRSECPTDELPLLRKRIRRLVEAAAAGGTMPRSRKSLAASARSRR